MVDRYDVFLSHAQLDEPSVGKLAARLRNEGVEPFFGRWMLIPGESRVRGIERGLLRSETVAVFVGPRGPDAWRDQQADFALIEGAGRRVIPVLLPGTPDKALQGMLRARVWVQLDEPEGFDRLLAGIRGHAPDLTIGFEPTAEVRDRIEDARNTELRRPQAPANPTPYHVFVTGDLGVDPGLATQLQAAIEHAGMVPHGLDTPKLDSRREQLERCDLLLVLVGWRYGQAVDPDDRARVEIEYEWAKANDTPRLVMMLDADQPIVVGEAFDEATQRWAKQTRLDELKARLRQHESVVPFRRANLEARLMLALHQWRRQGAGAAAPTRSAQTSSSRRQDAPRPVATESPLAAHLQNIERDCGTVTMLGPAGPRTTPLRPDDLRVRVRPCAAASRPHADAVRSELTLHTVFRSRDSDAQRVVAMVGPRGSGKSTHLRRLALWLAQRGGATLGLVSDTAPLPIDLSRGLPPPPIPEAVRAHERLLLLVDGFDALTSNEQRVQAAAWLDETMARHPAATAVVARRRAHDPSAGPEDWDTPTLSIQLAPLTDDDARALVERWFAASPNTEDDAIDGPTARANALWQHLSSPRFRSARMFELARNPTMLTVLSAVFDDRGTLPTRRVELFEYCVEVLVTQWRGRAELPPRFGDREARQLLQVIAYHLHTRGTAEAPFEDLASAIEQPLQAVFRTEPVDPVAFLRSVSLDQGILLRRGEHSAGLLHPSLQQYLCAREIRARSHGNPRVLDRMAQRLPEPWWREVGLLLLELGDPALFRPLVDRLIDGGALADNTDWVLDSLTDSAEATLDPLVTLVSSPPSDAPAHWRDQLAAATIVDRVEPSKLANARQQLRDHPDPELRKLADPGPDGSKVRLSPRGAYAMVRVPATTFDMGSHHRARHHRPTEAPRHSVTLAAFSIGRAPVTNEDYGRYLRACPDAPQPAYWGDPRFNQPQQPVVGVSWHEALAYCTWAGLSLPTEAQWERACRGGKRTAFWSGRTDDDLAKVGWYEANSEQRLRPVAALPANRLGLHDMHGNVGEWCLDDFASYRDATPRPGDGLRHPPTPDHNRVIRGGSWIEPAAHARSAYRLNRHPDNRVSYVGFRAVENE